MIVDNRYNLISEIGYTRTSHVWLSQDLKSGTSDNFVAVKILESIDTKQDGIKELFRRECESLARLHHENIITFIDSGVNIQNDSFYIVTEYFKSQNLDVFKKGKTFTEDEIFRITYNILLGLSHAHQNNVVHRDLKPSNILVDEQFNVKIIDFGISKIIGYSYISEDTVCDHMTIAYASPEQLLRNEVRPSSDLFSLGAIIFFLTTGEHPPENKDLILPKIDKLDCCNELKQLMRALMQINPSQRPDNIHQVIRDAHSLIKRKLGRATCHLLLSNNIPKELYNLGLASYHSYDHAKSSVEDDLKISKIYKRKNTYYVIGKKGKYHSHLSTEKNCLVIFRVNNIDDYTEWEKETRKAIDVDANLRVIKSNYQLTEDAFLQEFLLRVEIEEKKRQVNIIREELRNKLLTKWEKVIDEEVISIEKRKSLCPYSSYELSDNQEQLIVNIEKGKWQFEQGDYIQMSTIADKSMNVGTLSEIEEDKIIINLNWDIDTQHIAKKGIIGIDVQQTQTNLKRLRRAVKAIKLKSSVNPLLSDIFSEPQLIKMFKVSPISEYMQELDPANKRAVQKALSTKDICLIQGPPGTGKTTVITEIVCQILKTNPKAKILLSSQSHVAVDHALKNITKLLPESNIIRIGRADKISEDVISLMMPNQIKKWVQAVVGKSRKELLNYIQSTFNMQEGSILYIESLLNDIDSEIRQPLSVTKDGNDTELSKLISITRQWYRRLGKSEEFDAIFARKSSIVASTCLGIASRNALNSMVFDWVIVDEAGRATPPELLVPIIRGKRIILVGDHKQLPPVVNSELSQEALEKMDIRLSDLEKSLFEDLIEKAPDDAKVILTSQFRMHPAIAKLIAEVFYPNVNITTNIKPEQRMHKLSWWPRTITWFNTQNLNNTLEQEVGLSKRNHAEAEVILKILEDINQQYRDSSAKIRVGVISGYAAQKALLINLVAPNNTERWKNIKIIIDNVDAFQGSETDIAIYSVVRCNKDNCIGFLHDSRRLNVALSRARNALIIVGNIHFIERVQSNTGNPFLNLLSYMKKNHAECLIEDAKAHYAIGGNS